MDFFYYTTLNYSHETDYTYDNAYRLTGFDVDGTSSTTYDRTFTYDRNGNRQKRNSDNYVYGWEQSETTGLNQLKSAHSKTYTYDANGNIATFDGNTFAYDYRNLCTGITGAVARTYSYDASGRRVKETDGSTHYYIYDGNTLIAEYTGSTLTAKYIYGNGKILKVDGNGIKWYYMNDHLGSRRVLYSSQGEIGDDYYPFGEIMQHQGNENGYNKFTGKKRDAALGMDHFLARDYLPQTGRFNGSDPVMEYSNPYSYVANRPLNFVDPLGMQKHNGRGDDMGGPMRFGFLGTGGIMGNSYYVDGAEVTGDFFYDAAGVENSSELAHKTSGRRVKKTRWVEQPRGYKTNIDDGWDDVPELIECEATPLVEETYWEWVDGSAGSNSQPEITNATLVGSPLEWTTIGKAKKYLKLLANRKVYAPLLKQGGFIWTVDKNGIWRLRNALGQIVNVKAAMTSVMTQDNVSISMATFVGITSAMSGVDYNGNFSSWKTRVAFYCGYMMVNIIRSGLNGGL